MPKKPKIQSGKSTEKLQQDYDIIASQFAETRKIPFKELHFLEPYLEENCSILDIGCGTGRAYQWLQGRDISFDYTGIDISENQLKEAKKQFPKVTFLQGNMLHLDFEDATFERVFMIASLHHLPSKVTRLQALQEAYRVLKPGGILCMTNWNLFQPRFLKHLFPNIIRNITSLGSYSVKDFIIPWKDKKGTIQASRYYYAFTKKGIEHLSEKSGFRVLKNVYARGENLSTMSNARNIVTILKKHGEIA